MKSILPLGLSLGLLLLAILSWDIQYHQPHQASGLNDGRIKEKAGDRVAHSLLTQDIRRGTSTISTVTISETAIERAAAEQVNRLHGPLGELFSRWGLSPSDLERVLDAIRRKVVASGLARNDMASRKWNDSSGDQANAPDPFKSINLQYEADVLSILGSTQKLYEMTNLVGQANLKNYRSHQPEMRKQTERITDLNRDLVARLKAQHGDKYVSVMREKYGDTATESMLALSEGAGD